MRFSHIAAPALGALGVAACNCTIPVADVKQGRIEGFFDSSRNFVWLGIPYAATTGGQNRWKAPQDPAPYSVLNATTFGPTCPQAISRTPFSRQDEDCLNLNIWAPSSGTDLPVFVYMYGGAMVTGSSSNTQLQGNNFARKGVIFVSFNTRESIFAYPNSAELDGTSQNFGILDVEKAMTWVRENIAVFGGNPDRIVFGGHSSGGVQVDHYLWNNPNSFLAGAVEMSANAASGPGNAPPNVGIDTIAAEVGCANRKDKLACLRGKDIFTLETASFNASVNTWFVPAVDNKTRFSVAEYANRFAAGKYPSHVPLLTGNSNGEGAIFSMVYGSENTNFSSWISTFDADSAHIPRNDLIAAYNTQNFTSTSVKSGTQYGDARFNCAVDFLVDLRSSLQKTWEYRWFGEYANVVGAPVSAPTHGTEIPFFFGGNEAFDGIKGVTKEQQALADFTNDWFVAWIKNPSAGPGWAQTKPINGPMMKLGVSGNELALVAGTTSEWNGVCQSLYKKFMPLYPVVQSPVAVAAK